MPNTTAPTKAAACGLPIEYTLQHTEPVIFNYSGTELHDRVQLTVGMRDLWYLIEALDTLRMRGDVGGVDDPEPREVVRELHGQLVAFWRVILEHRGSHAGVCARALRLSNRDGFHSPDQPGK